MDKDIFIKLLAQREFKAVRSILDVMNEVDIASLLSTLSDIFQYGHFHADLSGNNVY